MGVPRETYTTLKSNETKFIHHIDPYKDKSSKFMLKFFAEPGITYKEITHIKPSDLKKHQTLGLKKGFVVPLRLKRRIDQDTPLKVNICFENINQSESLKDTEYDNFMLRQLIYQRTKSFAFSVFTPFIACNETEHCIELMKNVDQRVIINPHSNSYFLPTKIS